MIGDALFSGSANNWWERSPNSSNSTNFCRVNAEGSAYAGIASGTLGLAPAWAL